MNTSSLVSSRLTLEKVLNKAFLLLQDFEFSDSPEDSDWALITSTTPPYINPDGSNPPVPAVGENAFVNSSLSEVNTFIRSHEEGVKQADIHTSNWIIIDQQSLDQETCILCEQPYDPDMNDGEGGMTSTFRAVRITLSHAWIMFANLETANMGFEEWIDEDAGVQDDGTWKWVGPFTPSNPGLEKAAQETEEKRQAALKVLKELGHID